MKRIEWKNIFLAVMIGSLVGTGVIYATPHLSAIGEKAPISTLTAKLYNANGQNIGAVTLSNTDTGVKLQVSASHLSPGKHGIHIHQKAFTDFDFSTAGEHFNPYGKNHGLKNPEGPHLGDMPNLEVNQDGTANAELLIEGANLIKGDKNSLLGKSVIIHAKEDDQITDPAGNSGDRVAGANIPE
ncbi:superoxide dismutase family protein [Brevibacillus sp. SYSU BS000544]|uniref:superoxide dismutase family protein n=1 Tax=Brevibacillus sp. SYSU BS000544 TaxID=3416443 RepID=UPI003CE55254